jgi:hypothetical protein
LKYEDFHIAAEWNFFATSHGKICWDGIGWVKRLVAHASLYETERNQILTPKDLCKWAKGNITGITFFYITQTEIKVHVPRLTDRLQYAKTVPDTESHCKSMPINTSETFAIR